MQLSEAVTREHCRCVVFAFRRRDGRLCEMAQNRFTMQPLQKTQDDSLYRVVGTERTSKGQGASFREDSTQPKAHQSDSGEGRRPWPPTRPRAPPHGVPKGSARAGRVQRPRRRHSVWQRINARLSTSQAAANISNARSPLSVPPRPRTRRPGPRGAAKKNGPAAAQPPALPRLQLDGPAGHDVVRSEHGADRALWYLWVEDSKTRGTCGSGVL